MHWHWNYQSHCFSRIYNYFVDLLVESLMSKFKQKWDKKASGIIFSNILQWSYFNRVASIELLHAKRRVGDRRCICAESSWVHDALQGQYLRTERQHSSLKTLLLRSILPLYVDFSGCKTNSGIFSPLQAFSKSWMNSEPPSTWIYRTLYGVFSINSRKNLVAFALSALQ